jgi:hypothetical protein
MAPRVPKDHWTARDTENATKLELPLLLLLKRSEPQDLKALRDRLDHGKEVVERSLRCLCSRGLAHRREEIRPARFHPLAYGEGETHCVEQVITRRWVLSERGVVWRDRRIAQGDLAQLPERYRGLLELAGQGKRPSEIQLPLVEAANA